MRKIFLMIMSLVATFATAQVERPKLVVGIVVDQMRWDYLYRYQARYCDGGFKRLLGEGFSCENTQIPYIPSVTAIGHTSIYTGSVPSIHGIAGNTFCIDGKPTYCTDDPSVESVGSNGSAGKMSPVNLWSTTIGDELRAATNNRSKVIGVAIKDRAAILPAGRNANAAYWFDSENGCFVTSTYYMDKLPKWAEKFNKSGKVDEYLSKNWETLYPIDTYKESTADATVYEDDIRPGVKATLPLDLKALSKKYGKGIIKETPFGIDLTFDMARAAIEGENLGKRDIKGETDFLAVSCSSTDMIGHQVGIRAIEIEDTYLRLDKAIADFLSYLDNRVGKGNYLVFLSADHGAMDNAQYLLDNRTPAGSFSERQAKADINKAIREKFNISQDLAIHAMNFQVFFDLHAIDSLSLDYEAVKAVAVETLKRNPEVLYACDMEKASTASIPEPIKYRIINGYNRERSGGVQIVTRPGYYYGSMKGTTHGMWNPYDTHIPLIFMGWGIKHGASTKECHMTDIAPTLCALLHIQAPSGTVGEPISSLTTNNSSLTTEKDMSNYKFTEADKKFIEMAAQLSEDNVKNGGGPFGAVIVKDGEVIATGVNRVTANNDPTAHAEVSAIREACKKLGSFKLDGCTIYSSCEPCPMCLSALYWAGVKAIIYGNTKEDADAIGFGDKFIYEEIDRQPSQRSIPCYHIANPYTPTAFKMWTEKADKVEY